MTPTQFKNTRQLFGLTQVQIAQLLSITRQQVYNYEHGVTPVPALVAHKLKTTTKKEIKNLLTNAK